MLVQANRAFICSVVFIDLVGYSKKPVTEQIRLKTSLTNNLSEAIKDIPVNDRIILETGDGAAISFLGDPEDALFDLLIADHLNTSNILFIMDDGDVDAALASPLVAFCTDSPASATNETVRDCPGSKRTAVPAAMSRR